MTTFTGSSTRAVRWLAQVVLVLTAMGGSAARVSAQTTVTLSAPGSQISADQTIQGGTSATVDFSTNAVLASKVSSVDYARRFLLQFATETLIPAHAVIQSARLDLVLESAESAETRPISAFHVDQSMVSGQIDWFSYGPGQAWTTPGGDLTAGFGTTNVGNTVGATYSFDLTAMVQRTVNGDFGSRNTGVALIDTGAATSGNYRAFHSSRAATVALRPRLVITYGEASPTGATLRLMQWNMHKTKGSDELCDPDRIANTIVAQNVDVVSLNEVNFFSGSCAWTFDMSERLQTLIQQKTGLTWYRQSVNAGGLGNVLLSRLAPVSSSSTLLSNGRGVAQMGLVVNGRTVNVFSTHVEYENASWRPGQIREAVQWMTTFAEPRIVMGDFNTPPATSDYSIIATPYQDAWMAASSAGTASSYNGTGATHGASRFDYVFYSRVATLALTSVKVPATLVNNVMPSDHDPVIAVFTVQ